MKYKILMATTNPGKVWEIAKLLIGLPVEILHMASGEVPEMEPSPEDHDTFRENAIQKAKHYGDLSGFPTIAEDAGLTIDALNGWPGVHSSRIAKSDPERIAKVLGRLGEIENTDRSASFVSVAAYYDPFYNRAETFEGTCRGMIINEPRGHNGFGYDPIFFREDLGKTMAELSTEEKNLISHRGQSFRALVEWIRQQHESSRY